MILFKIPLNTVFVSIRLISSFKFIAAFESETAKRSQKIESFETLITTLFQDKKRHR